MRFPLVPIHNPRLRFPTGPLPASHLREPEPDLVVGALATPVFSVVRVNIFLSPVGATAPLDHLVLGRDVNVNALMGEGVDRRGWHEHNPAVVDTNLPERTQTWRKLPKNYAKKAAGANESS